MGLREYREKRRFDRTPEPKGKTGKAKGHGRFVIQKHDATRLHYDFRLESEGVLKSWAVPKGPSLDPKEKRLAVEVEDHPLEYGSFEGIIPEGEYGGGTVLLWDQGRWQPVGSAAEGLRKGHLKFDLEGEKLRGRWALVRLRGREDEGGKPNWLLIKEKDEEARTLRQGDILKQRPESVASGRALEEIAKVAKKRGEVWHSKPASRGAKHAALLEEKAPARGPKARMKKGTSLPETVSLQLATLVSEPPQGDEWIFEIKLDGYRIQASVAGGETQLITRNGKDWTAKFPSIAAAVSELKVESALLDGEVAALAADGRTSFQALQTALSDGRTDRLTYFVFDLLHLNGKDLSDRPLDERKRALRKLLPPSLKSEVLRFNDHVEAQGDEFYAQACRLGIEGIIAKRRDAPYRGGRSTDWLKVKCLMRQEVVIGGFTAPQGTRNDFGALLVGVYEGGKKGGLLFSGKVGTGFDAPTLRSVLRRLEPLVRETSPFANPPRGATARGVRWVEPQLVAEVSFTEWTDDGRLRHPSFQGLREDKPAREVRRERPQAPPQTAKGVRTAKPAAAKKTAARRAPARAVSAKGATKRASAKSRREGATDNIAGVAGIHLTHPDRVLYPEQGLTKLDLAEYYQSVGDWILPHLEHRPLSLVRCPQGSEKGCFYQKHLREGLPDAVHSVDIEEKDGGHEPYPMVDSVAGLVSLVQIGVLELHGWGSLADDVDKPDRLVFDLDPDPSVPWKGVVEAARLLRERLAELGLQSFVQTTGGKGLHVLAPLARRRDWDEVKPFARALAECLVAEAPELYLSKASKAARKGKIFIDWLRNGRGATAIVPYSTRARKGATVATPLDWGELDKADPAAFNVETVPGRLAKLKKDPWAEFWKVKQSLRADALKKLKVAT